MFVLSALSAATPTRFRACLCSLLAGVVLAGCTGAADKDDDTDGPSGPSRPPAADCRSFTPCGGNPLGRWVMVASCIGSVPTDPACAGYASNQSVSGTAIYDFGSDGILRFEGSVHVRYDVTATEACAQAVARRDAASYCKLVEASRDDNPQVPATIDCTASDGVCSCHVDQGPITGGSNASYALSGNSITLLSGGAAETLGYCVGVDTLTLGTLTGIPTSVFVRQ